MKIKVILTALILTAVLTACADKSEVPDIPAETTAETTVITIAEPSGTFNEEVFDEVVNNIVIGDRTISLPCTIEDLGKDFSYSAEFPYYDKESGVAFYGLLYNEKDIGTAIFKYEPDDKDLSDNQILGLSLGTIFMERENCGLYLAGLTLNDTEDAVIDKLGQPTKFNGENGNGIMYYRVFNNDFVDEKYITIDLEDGKVSMLHIQLPINKN